MLIKSANDIPSSEITPEAIYLKRRELMKGALAGLAVSAFPSSVKASDVPLASLSYKAG